MSAAHTPGPWTKAERLNGPWWHISSGHTIGGEQCKSGRQAVASVHGESKSGSVAYAEMFEANARLIAAAPELLHALEVAEQFMAIASDWNIDEAEINGEMRSTYEWLDVVRAAIAKATGGSV